MAGYFRSGNGSSDHGQYHLLTFENILTANIVLFGQMVANNAYILMVFIFFTVISLIYERESQFLLSVL